VDRDFPGALELRRWATLSARAHRAKWLTSGRTPEGTHRTDRLDS
jgi:hypothetical protein